MCLVNDCFRNIWILNSFTYCFSLKISVNTSWTKMDQYTVKKYESYSMSQFFFINFNFVMVNLTLYVKLPHSVFVTNVWSCLRFLSAIAFLLLQLELPTQTAEAEIIITQAMESSERSLGRKASLFHHCFFEWWRVDGCA